MIKLINKTRKRDGVFSLLTFGFFAIVGLAMIIFLWALNNAIGAYNTLYIANQNAAIAAASTAHSSADAEQLVYTCRGEATLENRVNCGLSSGDSTTAAAAAISLQLSLENNQFGIRFGQNTFLQTNGTIGSGGFQGVRAYSVDQSPGDIEQTIFNYAEQLALTGGNPIEAACRPSSSRYNTDYVGPVEVSANQIHCWTVEEANIQYSPIYTSGVVTRVVSRPDVFPDTIINKCPDIIQAVCNPEIIVVSAASQAQPDAYDNYNKYSR